MLYHGNTFHGVFDSKALLYVAATKYVDSWYSMSKYEGKREIINVNQLDDSTETFDVSNTHPKDPFSWLIIETTVNGFTRR